MADPSCAKCGKRMEQGYIIDTSHYSMPTVGVWHRGAPKKSFFGLKVVKADKYEITAWRCTGCGFLEHYAP